MSGIETEWQDLRGRAAACTNCELHRQATQTVFGRGPATARVLVVGEQPGDEEDLAGAPFVGPAGRLLQAALKSAGMNHDELYVTNAVKHFKWVPRGKRRLHQTPNQSEVNACRPWLLAEVELVAPVGVVALGATASKAILGPQIRVTRDRGQMIDTAIGTWSGPVLVTLHPSAILRVQESADKAAELDRFIEDLRLMRAWTQ